MIIETERLLLRPFAEEDLAELTRLRSDPEVARYIGGAAMQSSEAIAKRFRFYMDCYARHSFSMMPAIRKDDKAFVGWGGLQPLEETGEIEVGYGLLFVQSKESRICADEALVEDAPREFFKIFLLEGAERTSADLGRFGNFFQSDAAHFAFTAQFVAKATHRILAACHPYASLGFTTSSASLAPAEPLDHRVGLKTVSKDIRK